MKGIIKFKIECSENTCFLISGKSCNYLRIALKGPFGHGLCEDSCLIFGNLTHKDGIAQRHKKCIKMMEKEGE